MSLRIAERLGATFNRAHPSVLHIHITFISALDLGLKQSRLSPFQSTGDSAMATIFGPIGANASVNELDHRQLYDIIMPDLQDMANNQELLEQVRERRFNRDEPPPYRSPTPDEGHGGEYGGNPALWPQTGRSDAEIEDTISRPLSEEELRKTQHNFESWQSAYPPGERYEKEAEQERMFGITQDPGARDPKIYALLDSSAGPAHAEVFARHRIKKRWERLGVWNPDWGIPGRVNEGPRDKTSSWKWSWQGDTPEDGADPDCYLPEHPNSRAMHLRQGLSRGQRSPLQPRHSLTADVSKSASESFITSRPWYVFGMDLEEERTRLDRFPYTERVFPREQHQENVVNRWRESGDWSTRCQPNLFPGWKWKHESPSPEPEDLRNVEFTPSEVDAIEAIPPPTPPRARPPPPPPPKGRRMIVPGTENQFFTQYYYVDSSPEPQESGAGEAAAEEKDAPGDEANAPAPLPQKAKRGRPPGRRIGGVAKRITGDAPGAVRTRRSARIAEQDQRVEVTPAQAEPKPKSRKTRTTAGARSVPSASTKRRGRPPKATSSEGSKPQGITKRRGRPPKADSSKGAKAPVIAKRGRQPKPTSSGAPEQKGAPKKRGRPPKAAPPKAPEPQGVTKRRGRPPKAVSSKAPEPQGANKRRGRPPKATPSEGSKPQGVVKRRGRPPKPAPSGDSNPQGGPKRRGRPRKA